MSEPSAEPYPRPEIPNSVSRRRFLAAGGIGVVGLSLAERAQARDRNSQKSVILIVLTGGASAQDTFDPKPLAPREIRGPQRAIATALPGVHFAECLPLLAQRADQLTLVRSLHHDRAPIHETGLQLLQTGDVVRGGHRPPSIASLLCSQEASPSAIIPAVEVGGPLLDTGTKTYRADALQTPPGQTAPQSFTNWTSEHGIEINFDAQPAEVRERYGASRFGRLLWQAGCLVASGARFVTVHTFDTLSGQPTWDAHGGPHAPATVFTYRDELGPRFDRAAAALLDDLTSTGLIDHTLVVCTGEMGRTPRINEQGGRDHWTRAWSGFLAGAQMKPGQVIGATDETGATITAAPVPLANLATLIRSTVGLPSAGESANEELAANPSRSTAPAPGV